MLLESGGLLRRSVLSSQLRSSDVPSLCCSVQPFTPPLLFLQSLVLAPAPQIASGSESWPFSDLLYSLHLSQPGERYDGRTGSSPPPVGGRQKYRPHVDRNRIPDSREFSSKKIPGHRLLRLPL